MPGPQFCHKYPLILTNWKLSLCQSILLTPDTELVQHSHQRFSTFRKRIFHLRRDLRILGADDQFVCFQLLKIRAESLVGNGFQIPFQLIESHGLELVLYHLTFLILLFQIRTFVFFLYTFLHLLQ